MTVVPQHMAALASANEKRTGMAAFKRSVRCLSTRAAAERVAQTLEQDWDDRILGSMRARHALMCIPRLGQTKMTTCLVSSGVRNFDRRLRDLTPRQRTAVAFHLRHWALNYREAATTKFVPGALRTASQLVESRPESMRGEPQVGGCDVRFPTPSPWGES